MGLLTINNKLLYFFSSQNFHLQMNIRTPHIPPWTLAIDILRNGYQPRRAIEYSDAELLNFAVIYNICRGLMNHILFNEFLQTFLKSLLEIDNLLRIRFQYDNFWGKPMLPIRRKSQSLTKMDFHSFSNDLTLHTSLCMGIRRRTYQAYNLPRQSSLITCKVFSFGKIAVNRKLSRFID